MALVRPDRRLVVERLDQRGDRIGVGDDNHARRPALQDTDDALSQAGDFVVGIRGGRVVHRDTDSVFGEQHRSVDIVPAVDHPSIRFGEGHTANHAEHQNGAHVRAVMADDLDLDMNLATGGRIQASHEVFAPGVIHVRVAGHVDRAQLEGDQGRIAPDLVAHVRDVADLGEEGRGRPFQFVLGECRQHVHVDDGRVVVTRCDVERPDGLACRIVAEVDFADSHEDSPLTQCRSL